MLELNSGLTTMIIIAGFVLIAGIIFINSGKKNDDKEDRDK